MSDIIREQAKWSHEKAKVITTYIQAHRDLFSAVAGRGFLFMPGFVGEMESDLELGIKFKISDVNYTILTETIERELKQAGLDYDLAFKNAQLVWELGRQTLIGDWTSEHAAIKRGMADTEEALLRLMVAQQARTSIIMAAKTIIELDIEAQRLILVQLSGDTVSYEVDLANQKVITANKRLLVIPILQQIVQAETELITDKLDLIAAKRTLLPEEQALLAEMQRVAAKKLSLAPILGELTAQLVILNSALTVQGETLSQILEEKLLQAGYKIEIATQNLARASTLSEIYTLENEISIIKLEMDTISDQGSSAALSQEALDIKAAVTKEKEVRKQLETSDREANQQVIENKTTSMNGDKQNKLQNNQTVTTEDNRVIATLASYQRQTNDEVSTIQMQESVITANLTHLLGV